MTSKLHIRPPILSASTGCLLILIILPLNILFAEANIVSTNVQNLMTLIPDYQLQIQESFFQPFSLNISRLISIAIIGNFLFVSLLFYVLAFLPENRIRSSKRRVNGDSFQAEYEDEYYDEDYYYDDQLRRLHKRSDEPLPLPNLSFLTSEEEMESRSSKAIGIKNGLSHFFTYPVNRVTRAFGDLYRIYENYWRGVVGSGKFRRRKFISEEEDALRRNPFSHHHKHHKRVHPEKNKRIDHRRRHSF